jgi:NAD(P)H dehydrogenase (quinone)
MNVLMVTAHPCADSFTHAVAAAARRGLERGTHDVTSLDLYALGFAPAMSAAERAAYHTDHPLIDPLTAEHAQLVQRAQMLVFVYPTWWSGPPAILRGWLERVLVPGVAFRFDARGKVRPALTNVRRIVGISTYGSPWLFVKLLNDGGRRMLTRALRLNCGWRTRTRWIGLYSFDTLGDAQRAAFLGRVERSIARWGAA